MQSKAQSVHEFSTRGPSQGETMSTTYKVAQNDTSKYTSKFDFGDSSQQTVFPKSRCILWLGSTVCIVIWSKPMAVRIASWSFEARKRFRSKSSLADSFCILNIVLVNSSVERRRPFGEKRGPLRGRFSSHFAMNMARKKELEQNLSCEKVKTAML